MVVIAKEAAAAAIVAVGFIWLVGWFGLVWFVVLGEHLIRLGNDRALCYDPPCL